MIETAINTVIDSERTDGSGNRFREVDLTQRLPQNSSKRVLSTIGEIKGETEFANQINSIDGIDVLPRPEQLNQPAEIVSRNKRLFGALMGHLGAARKVLEKDASKIDQQIHAKTIVTVKNQVESQRLLGLHNRIRSAEKDMVNLRREKTQLQKKQRDVDMQFQTFKIETQSRSMQLITTVTPPIQWSPFIMNGIIQRVLDDQKLEVDGTIAEREAEDSNARSILESKISEIELAISEHEKFLKSEEVTQITEKTAQAIAQASDSVQGTQSEYTTHNIDRHSEIGKRRWVEDNRQGNYDLRDSIRGRIRYQENVNTVNVKYNPRSRHIEYVHRKDDRFHNETRGENRIYDRRSSRNLDWDKTKRNPDFYDSSLQNRQNSRHSWTGSSATAENIDDDFELYTKKASSNLVKLNGRSNNVGASELDLRKREGNDFLIAEDSFKERGFNHDADEVEIDVVVEHNDEGSDLLAALDGKL